MRILITGARGFVGQHLTDHLTTAIPEAEIYGTTRDRSENVTETSATLITVELNDETQVRELIGDIQPDVIYHLAAQAFVPRSFEAPWETLENNIKSQLNIFQACRQENLRPRTLIISSAEVYGRIRQDQLPITEDAPLQPTSPYGVSKAACDLLAQQYHDSYDLPLIICRPFNHIGPGQNEDFVAPAFAMQIARIEAGQQEPIISVGDLSAERDFTDVRDIVRAYRMIIENGEPGTVFNVSSGVSHSIQSMLDNLLRSAKCEIQVAVDPARLRPSSMPVLRGDSARLRNATGWKPEIPFDQSLSDILNDCRQRIQQ